VPDRLIVQTGQHARRVPAEGLDRAAVVLAAGAPPCDRDRSLDAPQPEEERCILRQPDHPRRRRDLLALDARREAPAVPALEYLAERALDLGAETQAASELLSDLAV